MKEALRKLGSCFWKLDALPTKEGGLPLCSFSSDFVCLFCLFFGFRPRADEAPALPELGPVPQTSKAKKTKKGSAKVKAMIAQSHSCPRNSSGFPLQATCESFLQGQENIQQLQHFRGVIPELFSFHRPQAEEDFQKTSRLSLPASLQRSSDSSSPSCCRREPRVIRSLSPLLQADPPIECRYEKASKRLLSHLSGQCQALGTTKERVDGQAQEFIEFLWEEGEGQSLAADVLSAIQHYQPSMRRCLNGSWRLFKTWQRFEIPARAPL